MDKPDSKDPKYANRVNLFVRDMRRWEATQYRPIPPLPPELLHLFTPESIAKAKAEEG